MGTKLTMREGGDAGETINDDDHPRTDDRRRRREVEVTL
jgi:hypothetical protein